MVLLWEWVVLKFGYFIMLMVMECGFGVAGWLTAMYLFVVLYCCGLRM